MKERTVKQIAESYAHRVWDNKDLQAIDELLHEECIIHSLLGSFHGKEHMKNVVQAWLTAFPDLTVTNISVISENDLAMIQWKANGTHRGEFKGIEPTGKPIHYQGVTIYRIFEAKIKEYWAYLDMQHIIKQIS